MNVLFSRWVGLLALLVIVSAVPSFAQESETPILSRPIFEPIAFDFNKLSWMSSWNPISIIGSISSSSAHSPAQSSSLLRLPSDWVVGVPDDNPARAPEKFRGDLVEFYQSTSSEEVRVNVIVFPNMLNAASSDASFRGATVEKVHKIGNILTLLVPKNRLLDIATIPAVKSVWPDRVFRANLDSSVPQINAQTLWNEGYTGSGVKVAVLDAGVNSTHPMLVGRVTVAQSFTGEPVDDTTGHGTHVAGIIGGKQNGANTFNGVAPDVELWNIKVLDNTGSGNETLIVEGINYAVDPDNNPATGDGVDVINISFGGPYTDLDSPIVEAVEDAIAAGVVVVIASGNCGPGCPSGDCQGFVGVETPGDAPNAITVGAVDDASQWACFSSGGLVNNGLTLKPDVVAPGVNITSSSLNSTTATLSGTSMAAPHVSGVAALLLQANPTISPQNVKDILEQTASDFGDPGKDSQYGSGLIDASQMLPSSVLTFLKYKLTQNASVVDKGNPVSFTITSSAADVQSITLDVNTPNQLIVNVPLTQNGLEWSGNFSSTAQIGTHLVTATITNIANDVTVIKKSFAVKAPSTTGALLSHDLPSQVNFGQPVQVNVQFQNTGAFDTDVLVELQEWKGDYFERIRFSNATPVSSGQTVFIPVNWTPETSVGLKTIKLVTVFDDTALEVDQNVFVEDSDVPVVWNFDHPFFTKRTQPVMVDMYAGDLTPLTGTIHVLGPGVDYNIPMFPVYDSDFNRVLSGIIEPKQLGFFEVGFTLCDSATTPNCVTNFFHSLNISGCTLPKVLVVLGSGSQDDFNFISPTQYCIGFWDDTRQTPSAEYLNLFPLVYWVAGSSYSGGLDENAIAALSNYTGNLVLEGSYIPQRSETSDFIQSRMRAQFSEGIPVDTNTVLAKVYPHYIFQNTSSSLPFSGLSFSSYASGVTEVNGGVSLADWNNGSSGIVAFDSGAQKSLLMSFDTGHLAPTTRQTLIQNIFSWAFTSGGIDLVVRNLPGVFAPSDDLNTGAGALKYLVDGPNNLRITTRNAGNADAAIAAYGGYANGVLQSTQSQFLPAGFSKTLIFPFTLAAGDHNVFFRANPNFTEIEPNTLNNEKGFSVWVAPSLPNLRVLRTEGFHTNGVLQTKTFVSNWGGSAVSNVQVSVTIDQAPYSQNVTLQPGDVVSIDINHISPPHNFPITASIDPLNSIPEADESDNTKQSTLYVCTKQDVLIVNDDDAQIYWADEDFSGNASDLNASSAALFEQILKENGYCTSVWNESAQGAPSSSTLNQFPLVIWSTGDYWSQVIDANDEVSIRNYAGSILFEGNDIAFDHADDAFSFDVLRVDMNHDVFSLSGVERVTLNSSIFPSLSFVDVNFYHSSFADAVTPINGSFSSGEWPDGNSAVTLFSAPAQRTAFMGFALDSISTLADQNSYTTQLVSWLLQAANLSASAPTSITCNGATCTGNYSNTISLACAGSIDPEGDTLTYSLESALSSGSSNWWNAAYSHRVPITIAMSGDQNNFRTSIDLDSTTFPNPAFWSTVQSNFGDVRFVHNGVELKYYRPVYGNGTFASFWVEFDAVSGNNTIDMYFGNPSVAYVGKNNPTEFFLTNGMHLVDDFDDGVLTNWNVRSGTWQESGGILQRTGGASSEDQITKDWLQRGSSFYIRAQGRPTNACVNTEIALTRDTYHAGPTYLDEFFGLSVDNACPNGYLYAQVDTDHSPLTQNTGNSNPQVLEDNKTEVLISRTGWMGAFISDSNASAFKKVMGWESMDHTFPYLSVANHGGQPVEADEIYTSNAPNHAYDLNLSFGNIQTPSSGGSSAWQEIGTHAAGNAFAWDINTLATQSNVGLRCRAIDLGGSAQYSPYYTHDQNISLN